MGQIRPGPRIQSFPLVPSMDDPPAVEGWPEPAEAAAIATATAGSGATRKDNRKALKTLKRKQIQKEAAIKDREEEALSNDPEEQLKARQKEQEEAEAAERTWREFEERERLWLEAAAARRAEEERRNLLAESKREVCKNVSYHLRGNVYVHYKSLESAILAYNAINGRCFAGKQMTCEFVGVTRWKIAICGEYMKTRVKTCSHGTACNFIHCFCNPGGDYDWADWDKLPPKYWIKKMAALFGPSVESAYHKQVELEDHEKSRDSSRKKTPTDGWHRPRRVTYVEMDNQSSDSDSEDSSGKRGHSRSIRREHSSGRRKTSFLDKHEQSKENHKSATHGYNVKYSYVGHDSHEDSTKEKNGVLLKKHQIFEERNSLGDHERHKKRHKTKENIEPFSYEQSKSERKYNIKYHKRHHEECRSSARLSDHTDDNRDQWYGCSSEEPYATYSIDAQGRYDVRYHYADSDSDKDLCEPRYQHGKKPTETGEVDQFKSQQVRNHRFSSDESPDRWEFTDRYLGRKETHDPSLTNGRDRSYRRHSKGDQKGKHHRHNREYETSNSDSGNKLDGMSPKRHSRRQTPI